jgi:hypothetical protein
MSSRNSSSDEIAKLLDTINADDTSQKKWACFAGGAAVAVGCLLLLFHDKLSTVTLAVGLTGTIVFLLAAFALHSTGIPQQSWHSLYIQERLTNLCNQEFDSQELEEMNSRLVELGRTYEKAGGDVPKNMIWWPADRWSHESLALKIRFLRRLSAEAGELIRRRQREKAESERVRAEHELKAKLGDELWTLVQQAKDQTRSALQRRFDGWHDIQTLCENAAMSVLQATCDAVSTVPSSDRLLCWKAIWKVAWDEIVGLGQTLHSKNLALVSSYDKNRKFEIHWLDVDPEKISVAEKAEWEARADAMNQETMLKEADRDSVEKRLSKLASPMEARGFVEKAQRALPEK